MKRILGLDAFRGFAILLVLVRHAFTGYLGGAGIVGVVMFFALSGYLISGVIDREVVRSGSFSFRRFYRNRLFRLIPALVFLLAALSAIILIWNPFDDADILGQSLLLGMLYLTNLPLGIGFSATLGHLWTLALEEQFYLVWPVLLVMAITRNRVRLFLALALAVGVALAWATALTMSYDLGRAYVLPTTWAVTLIVGSIGYFARHAIERVLVGARLVIGGMLSAAVLALGAILPHAKDLLATYLVGGVLIGGASVVLIAWAKTWSVGGVLRPIYALGVVSYAAYLWDYPLTLLSDKIFGAEANLGVALLTIAVSIGMAVVSWFAIEAPVARVKMRMFGDVPLSGGDPRHRAVSGFQFRQR